jgi:predicted HNH restriction endonuclease
MKTCSKCLETKPLTDFYHQADRASGSSFCKTCKNKYDIERWIENKKKAISYKGGACSVCGYNKFYGALEFHHQNPNEKEYEWGKLRLLSWEKIAKELDKCILLCANCHREAHQVNLS